MAFAQMARWLEPAKLNWACSASNLDAIDVVNLTAEQQELLKGIPDPMFRQTTRDFCVNQQFRKDYWVKGSRSLKPLEQAEALRALRVVLVQPRADVSLKVTGSIGEANLQEAVYKPILDLLGDHKIKTLGQIEQGLKGSDAGTIEAGREISFAQILQVVMILSATGAILPVQEQEAIAKANPFGDSKIAPGDGPSKEERENGFYDVLFIGEYPDGTQVRASVQGDKDPGYGSTSKMIAESALTLLETDTPGGVVTPGAIIAAPLLERLVKHAGLSFGVE
jgi:short subunit dehydrogenase-like uncharacterized protein